VEADTTFEVFARKRAAHEAKRDIMVSLNPAPDESARIEAR
jgi:hypothetical protein